LSIIPLELCLGFFKHVFYGIMSCYNAVEYFIYFNPVQPLASFSALVSLLFHWLLLIPSSLGIALVLPLVISPPLSKNSLMRSSSVFLFGSGFIPIVFKVDPASLQISFLICHLPLHQQCLLGCWCLHLQLQTQSCPCLCVVSIGKSKCLEYQM